MTSFVLYRFLSISVTRKPPPSGSLERTPGLTARRHSAPCRNAANKTLPNLHPGSEMIKTMTKRYQLFLFIALSVCIPFVSMASEKIGNDRTKEQIWALESDYLTFFKNAAHEKVIPMWHEKFLGWPITENTPNDKQAVISYLKKYASAPGNWKFKIERMGIQIFGNVAITHLVHHITFSRSDGSSYTRSTRITHTWINESGEWKILGGMSSRI